MVTIERETMHATVDDRVATVVLNRPEVLNCANDQWVADMAAILAELATRDRLRVIVLRGAGRAFCSGLDLTALSRGELGRAFFRGWEEVLRKLETIDPIVLAAIQSHCLGGGLQLALACDLRLAREDATFGVTAVREGIVPGIGMWRIARHAGLGRAKQLALAADVVDASTALSWGLVDYLAPAAAFEERIQAMTDRLLQMAPTSTRLTKKLANMAFDTSSAEFTEMFWEFQRMALASPEHLSARAERRAARAARLTSAAGT